MPKISSVTSKPTKIRCQIEASGAKRWLSTQLIKRYRALATSVISAISKYGLSAAMTVKAAYSPAEALLKKLARKPCSGESPAFRAAIPRVNATTK